MKLSRRQAAYGKFNSVNRQMARDNDFYHALRGDPTRDELEELLRQAVINTGGKPCTTAAEPPTMSGAQQEPFTSDGSNGGRLPK